MLDPKLLEVLACPVCRKPVSYRPEEAVLVCPSCRRRYRVEDGIPNMLAEQAQIPES